MRLLFLPLASILAAAAAAAAAAEPDPWARVPALPTGCYQADGFAATLQAADEAVSRDLARQKKINDALSEKVRTKDAMELASLQQQYMMEHPQEAMALMQRVQQLGATSADAEARTHETWKQLRQELSEIDGRYGAALDAAIGPIERKFEDLDARAQKDLVALGETWTYAPWAVAEWNTLTLQENAAYEKVCATWWAASGPFHGWLKRYRASLVEAIPRREEAELVGAGLMVQLVGTPAAPFRTTSTLTALREYMDEAAKAFGKRRTEPKKTR